MSATRKYQIKMCLFCGKEFVAKTSRKYCSKECITIAKQSNSKDTLCWQCGKATAGEDCPWANGFIPVEGWDATPTTINTGYKDLNMSSFVVRKCPLFIRG